MDLTELLTWESLGTFAGLMAVTYLVTQAFKYVWADATALAVRLAAIVTAVVVALMFNISVDGFALPVIVMATVNGLLVALATMKAVEITKARGLSDVEVQGSGSCPYCGYPLGGDAGGGHLTDA